MRYPVAIEAGDNKTAWGVIVSDLPGCFCAGDTLEEALTQTEGAIVAWIDAAIDSGQDVPPPSPIELLRAAHPEMKSWIWTLVSNDRRV